MAKLIDSLYSKESDLDSNYQHLKYYFEGYRETALSLIHGSDYLWDVLEIDQGRYSPGSAREVSYIMGVEQAKKELI
tara:strand:- start:50 stop:280 length:231 start_codon:yes stop_codon:yes gene_type:complete